jgi:hypothetical protein
MWNGPNTILQVTELGMNIAETSPFWVPPGHWPTTEQWASGPGICITLPDSGHDQGFGER